LRRLSGAHGGGACQRYNEFRSVASRSPGEKAHAYSRLDSRRCGYFHHFHVEWIGRLAGALNRGVLPPDYSALAEQLAGRIGPDVRSLQTQGASNQPSGEPGAGVALATTPPRSRFRLRAEPDQYAAKARTIVIRRTSNHEVIALVEIVSPGNTSSRQRLRVFVEKAVYVLRAGIHLVVVDLFPPGPRNPQGIHKAIWDELVDNDFSLPPGQPLTLASYIGGRIPEAFIEPTAVGATILDMPLFLTEEFYVPLPLEASYMSGWDDVPKFYRDLLTLPVS
jgi:hypothetical protein